MDLAGPRVRTARPIPVRKGFSGIELKFDEPLDPATALAENYQIVSLGKDGLFGTRDDKPVVIATRTYNPDTGMVTLTTAKSMASRTTHRLTVKGEGGVADLVGNFLDGNGDGTNGDPFVFNFGGPARGASRVTVSPVRETIPGVVELVRPAAIAKMRSEIGQVSSSVVDELLETRKLHGRGFKLALDYDLDD